MVSRLVGFLSGKLPLGIVFWLFGMLGCLVLGLVLVMFSRAAESFIATRPGFVLFMVAIAMAIAYLAAVLIATWNSASRHAGRKLFARLAKLAVILVVAAALYQLWRDWPSSISTNELIAMADQINSDLPAQIDADTRVEKVTASGRILTYEYRFTSVFASELDHAVVEKNLRAALKQTSCINTELIEFLTGGITVALRYAGKDGGHVTTVSIEPADCGF